MSKIRINKGIKERCLLTEVAPYETPILYSYWGAFNYHRNLKEKSQPSFLKNILESAKSGTIPFNFKYDKNSIKKRVLSLVHPGASNDIVDFYNDFEVLIVKHCQISNFSIRYPHSIAKYFVKGIGKDEKSRYIEEMDENKAYASSYFYYASFSHIHKYWESDILTSMEKRFKFQKHLDVQQCFPSIYTHSISWAVRGKLMSKEATQFPKDKSFGATFDKLMQKINYNETNGIVVGPELSRICAEVILQTVDVEVERTMKEQGVLHGEDYQCVRYLDDYYIYYNDESVADKFTSILVDVLESFKLTLNSSKIEVTSRPFISTISQKKLTLSKYINEFVDMICDERLVKRLKPQKEINKIRNILKQNDIDNFAITSFMLAIIQRRTSALNDINPNDMSKVLNVIIEVSFYVLSIETRVSSIYRVTNILIIIKKKCEKYLSTSIARSITDKIFFEISLCMENVIRSNSITEALNLIIATKELGPNYDISESTLLDVINKCKEIPSWEPKQEKRMRYFEIVTLLYYVENNSKYIEIRNELIRQSKHLLGKLSCKKYSEAIHLLLDLVSCPYLSNNEKNEMIAISFKTDGASSNQQKIGEFRNYVDKHTWFFNWNLNGDLWDLLKKKEFMLSY